MLIIKLVFRESFITDQVSFGRPFLESRRLTTSDRSWLGPSDCLPLFNLLLMILHGSVLFRVYKVPSPPQLPREAVSKKDFSFPFFLSRVSSPTRVLRTVLVTTPLDLVSIWSAETLRA